MSEKMTPREFAEFRVRRESATVQEKIQDIEYALHILKKKIQTKGYSPLSGMSAMDWMNLWAHIGRHDEALEFLERMEGDTATTKL